jgi:hypothetical protein
MFPFEILTAEEALTQLKQEIPASWIVSCVKRKDNWYQASLTDSEGQVQWSGEHLDPKILLLDALGWLQTRNHQVKHPAWKPREHEVPLYRPPITGVIPDPPDLDPIEVEKVYKTSR